MLQDAVGLEDLRSQRDVMTIKKKIVLFFVSIMVGLGFIFIILLLIGEKKTIIEVEGFEVEYKVTD